VTLKRCRFGISPHFHSSHSTDQNMSTRSATARMLLRQAIGLALAERRHEAESICRLSLAIDPENAAAHRELGHLQQFQRRLGEAEASFQRAIELDPELAGAWCELGNIYTETGQDTKAELALLRAIALQPDHADAFNGLGNLLKIRQRPVDAELVYRRAIALQPEFAEARINLATLLFSQGRFGEGWPFYAIRRIATKPPPIVATFWQGEALAGRSILIWPEQGHGDQIQFSRYAPLLKQLGAKYVTLACRPALKPLLQTLDDVDMVISSEEQPLPHDLWTLPLSLPGAWTHDIDSIPAKLPYLAALPSRIERWRHLLPNIDRRVGLVWKGSTEHANDSRRSLPNLGTLAPLWKVPGVTFISLQKGEDEAKRYSANQPLLHLGSDLEDFADSAAIIEQLDLVICVDTAIAHLAGALGKPCWVLLSAVGTDWRWLTERTDSPWYPGVLRLFRQQPGDDWQPLIAQVANALNDHSKVSFRSHQLRH
jgi:tetratricopeptide (TPR) repeat protein